MVLENQIKCVIWDLDETVWDGTLAENEDITIREEIKDLIALLDSKGVINSICSKNNYNQAKALLESEGVWDYFVFPVIDFVPKGQNVKKIVSQMQLRPENVLFVDDNSGNRNEVKYYCEGVMIADANDVAFIDTIKRNIAVLNDGSRLERYKLLEKKSEERVRFSDNKSFLENSEIKICVLRNPGDLTYKNRIIELANRANQLNFTCSKFKSSSSFEDEFESQKSISINHGAIFVYDKYGDYGLVGFYAFDERSGKKKLDHFFFSCRILNMGIERSVYEYLKQKYGIKVFPKLEDSQKNDVSYIEIMEELDDSVKRYIKNNLDEVENYKTSIIAGCASGMYGHYLPEKLMPARFDNFRLSGKTFVIPDVDVIIYTVFSDYVNSGWTGLGLYPYSKFKRNLENFIFKNSGRKIYFILASEKFPSAHKGSLKDAMKSLARAIIYGKSERRYKKCNSIVRLVSEPHNNVHLVDIGRYVECKDEQRDPRHFERIVIKRFCESLFV